MLRKKISDLFHKVQQTSSCHQKYREILRSLYNETPFEDFEIEFMRTLEMLFQQDVVHKNPYVERSLEFAAAFLGSLAAIDDDKDRKDDTAHPLLTAVIGNILQYHNLDAISARYRTCQFVEHTLKSVGEDAQIDNNIWNMILESLLERIKDAKAIVRLQAVRALARLQSPGNSECPVIHAFLARMYDVSIMVRKEVVESTAPTPLTVPKIVERVRDADCNIRITAFRRCSAIGPKMIKIMDRQSVVLAGFNDEHEPVKRCFLQDTLPKWLNAYNGDYLKFLSALKVDGFEKDMEQTEYVSKNVLEEFFKTHQIDTIIQYLPIGENKTICLEKLNYEAAVFWSTLACYLWKSDDTQEYLDGLIPDLLPFCVYIESVAKVYSNLLDGWKYIEFQYILYQLLLIVKNYDTGDEVGRKALKTLMTELLTTTKLDDRNITEIVGILDKLNPLIDSLTTEICSIISDIREPFIAQEPSEEMKRQNNFKLAELRVELNIITEECSEAAEKGDYQTALELKEKRAELNRKMEELKSEFVSSQSNQIRTMRCDSETLCRCLNILIGVLTYPKIQSLTTALQSCRDEFVLPLCRNDDKEVSWRVYKCLVLYCSWDRTIAQESLKLICSPIMFYRVAPHDDTLKTTLLISIAAFCDVLRLYGTAIFDTDEDNMTSMAKRRLNGTKRLYRMEHVEHIESLNLGSNTWTDVVDVLLDMLDDECTDIKEQACQAICKLVIARLAISPELVARLLLKWFNPLTGKEDQALQPILGKTIVCLANMDDIDETLEQAVVLVLQQLANAPVTSPLYDVDVFGALFFMAMVTTHRKQTSVHKSLAFTLCYKIADKPHSKCTSLYIQMLLQLDLELEDQAVLKEIIHQSELLEKDLVDKPCKKGMEKFITKQKKLLDDHKENDSMNETKAAEVVAQNKEARMSFIQQSVDLRMKNIIQTNDEDITLEDSINADATQDESLRRSTARLSNLRMSLNITTPVKRRKSRGKQKNKETTMINNISETTILHTIVENDEFKMGTLEDVDVSVATPMCNSPSSTISSTSSSTKRRGRPKKVVISETSSDSDGNVKRRGRPRSDVSQNSDSSEQNDKVRRSRRKRKAKYY